MKAEFNHTVSEVRYFYVFVEGNNKTFEWTKRTVPYELRGASLDISYLMDWLNYEGELSDIRIVDIRQVPYIEWSNYLLSTNQKPIIVERMKDYIERIEPSIPFKNLVSTDKMAPPVDVLLLLLSHSGEVYKGYFDGERYRTYRPSEDHKDDYASVLLATDVKAFMLFPVVSE